MSSSDLTFEPVDQLDDETVASFQRDGFAFIPAEKFWTQEEYDSFLSAASELESWPDTPGKWMKYYEDNLIKKQGLPGTEDQPDRILCRMENFLDYDETLKNLWSGEKVLKCVGQLFGEDAILYKEKINYKLPGGDGFKPHQDHAAGWWVYGQTLHISMLICIDPADAGNGALELVRGWHKKGLLGDEWKEVPEDVCEQMEWEMAPTKPGDVVFFDSFVPHRSGPNSSDRRRRVAYVTYAKKAEGDYRTKYYADKRISLPPDCEREAGKKYEYKI